MPNKYKFLSFFKIKGVPVRTHWSLTLLLLICLLAAFQEPSILLGAISLWGVMLLHECGHMVMAHRQGLYVISIDLYPIHGLCFYQASPDEYKNHLVSWGGVVAQAFIFIPAIVICFLFSDSLPWYINTPLMIFGYFSATIALINLVPSLGMDGESCWKAIPIYRQRRKLSKQQKKKRSHLRSVK